MRPTRHKTLVDKAVDAAVAAIEVYNKPSFSYREETFAILMLNAWELLLKARILLENDNKLKSIEVWIPNKLRNGKLSLKRGVPKRNRSGNIMTIGLSAAAVKVRSLSSKAIDDSVITNLELLAEVRDNAIHLTNKSVGLKKRVQEIGSGALRNFACASADWFKLDLSQYNFSIMPMTFESPNGILKTAFSDIEKGASGNLVRLISDKQAASPFDPARPFNVGVQIEMRFVRTTSPEAMIVKIGGSDPGAIPIVVTEEQVIAAYPWEYNDLIRALTKRYSDFMQNAKFHRLKRDLEKDESLSKVRYLDPRNKKSGRKMFYKPEALRFFDSHYTAK